MNKHEDYIKEIRLLTRVNKTYPAVKIVFGIPIYRRFKGRVRLFARQNTHSKICFSMAIPGGCFRITVGFGIILFLPLFSKLSHMV